MIESIDKKARELNQRRRREIEQKSALIEQAETRILESGGWKQTCRYASTWLYSKKMADGVVVLVSKETALSFQEQMDQGYTIPDVDENYKRVPAHV